LVREHFNGGGRAEESGDHGIVRWWAATTALTADLRATALTAATDLPTALTIVKKIDGWKRRWTTGNQGYGGKKERMHIVR
jgi:hypothetical protein